MYSIFASGLRQRIGGCDAVGAWRRLLLLALFLSRAAQRFVILAPVLRFRHWAVQVTGRGVVAKSCGARILWVVVQTVYFLSPSALVASLAVIVMQTAALAVSCIVGLVGFLGSGGVPAVWAFFFLRFPAALKACFRTSNPASAACSCMETRSPASKLDHITHSTVQQQLA